MSGARRLGSSRVYSGKVLALDVDDVEEPGGVRARREVVRHTGSVAVLPVHRDGRFVLVRQYRYPPDQVLWELPAGRRDEGESPEAAARRELEEEVGLRAGRLEPLCTFYTTPGFCDEVMHLYRATDLTQVPPRPEEDERLEIRAFPAGDVRPMIDSGEVREGKTLVALLLELARPGREEVR